MTKQDYVYNAIVTNVYDGDTITVDIDMGLKLWIHGEKLRLYRINAPEIRGSEKVLGKASELWLREKLQNKEIVIVTVKDKHGKYGRLLVDIYLDGELLNDTLVDLGLAVYKEY